MKSYKIVAVSSLSLLLSGALGGVLTVDSFRNGVVETLVGTVNDTKGLLGFGNSRDDIAITPDKTDVNVTTVSAEPEQEEPSKAPAKPKVKLKPINKDIELFAPNTRGNAYIVRSGQDWMLIDGGYVGDTAYLKKVINREKIKSFKYIISTSSQESSIGGLSNLVTYRPSDYIIISRDSLKVNKANSVRTKLSSQGLIWSVAKKVTALRLGEAKVTLLPLNKNGELAVQLDYKGAKFFISGDIVKSDNAYMKAVPTYVDTYLVGQSDRQFKINKQMLERLKPKVTLVNSQRYVSEVGVTKAVKAVSSVYRAQHRTVETKVYTDGTDVRYERR